MSPDRHPSRAVHAGRARVTEDDRGRCPSRVVHDDRARVAEDGSADAAIARIAGSQRGLVTRAQMTAAGLGRGAVAHRISNARLHRVHRGVYLVGHPVPAALAFELAAILAVGHGAVLSHRAAARLSGFVQPPHTGGPIDVSVATVNAGRRPGIILHVVAALEPVDIADHEGMRITAPARTLVDLSSVLAVQHLERAIEEALVQRRVRETDITEAVARLAHRPGLASLRIALTSLTTEPSLTRSEAEHRLLDLIRDARLPHPLTNTRVAGHEVDLFWPANRLIVEVDGFAYHRTRAAFERDRRRDGDLQAAGHRVLRLTWRRITEEPHAVVALIARALPLASHAVSVPPHIERRRAGERDRRRRRAGRARGAAGARRRRRHRGRRHHVHRDDDQVVVDREVRRPFHEAAATTPRRPTRRTPARIAGASRS